MQYWVTAQQLSDICLHLEAWGNSIVSVNLDTPDLFLLEMTNPIPEDEINALGVSSV